MSQFYLVTPSVEKFELFTAGHQFRVIFNVIIATEWGPWGEATHLCSVVNGCMCMRECCNTVNAFISKDAYQTKDV